MKRTNNLSQQLLYNQEPFCLNKSVDLDRFTDEFDITECLGKGAYGCVYAARHKLLKKCFAVKIVRSNE